MYISKEEVYVNVQNGSIVTPRGFSAVGIHAGLRKMKKDLGIIYCDVPASCGAVYTQNTFQAAPIIVTKDSIEKDQLLQAIVVNSACANACTGLRGEQDAYTMRSLTAQSLHVQEHHVAVASTGVIGEYLQMEKIEAGIKQAIPSKNEIEAEGFYEAILTTDIELKKACYETMIDGKVVTIAGAAKGSGMIHPNMATMLAFVTTDANIESDVLQQALRDVTNKTFNQITVDGETSTNDMVVVMASKLVEHQLLTEEHPKWNHFLMTLQQVCEDLAKQIAKDGEGATKLIEVRVTSAESENDAKMIAKKIVASNLVKTAIHGEDGNWGRIICAIGHSEGYVNPANISIAIGDVVILKNSKKVPYKEEEVTKHLQQSTVFINVDVGVGTSEGVAWGCDLSYEYVKINACYRT
jgi:glutamate N-acetyltransferase / amino-acid N-acetyltransferase